MRGGWISPRPKTAIARRVPLWAETVAALRVVLAERPNPKNEQNAGLEFLTKYGNTWVRTTKSKKTEGKLTGFDVLAQAVRQLMKSTSVAVAGQMQQIEYILDFYHVSEHVLDFAKELLAGKEPARQAQVEAWCHQLKQEGGRC